MGRRALNAVGVAAALLQAPADSFLGPTSTRAPGRNGSTLVRLGGVGWGRTCVLRGGHGQARGGGKADQRRRRDVKMNRYALSAVVLLYRRFGGIGYIFMFVSDRFINQVLFSHQHVGPVYCIYDTCTVLLV